MIKNLPNNIYFETFEIKNSVTHLKSTKPFKTPMNVIPKNIINIFEL